MITIVIGKSDIGQAGEPRTFDPRLQKSLGIVLCPVSLRMGVVIREQRRWSIGVLECWSVGPVEGENVSIEGLGNPADGAARKNLYLFLVELGRTWSN